MEAKQDKLTDILQTTISNAFFEYKCINFDYDLTDIFS